MQNLVNGILFNGNLILPQSIEYKRLPASYLSEKTFNVYALIYKWALSVSMMFVKLLITIQDIPTT